jgi:LysR family transcriptional regulator, nitrogen assimilation regulatory protein
MEMQKLLALIAVADTGSFSRAAARLNLAQPSLSRQLAALETDIGQRLLVRTGRGAQPTEAGLVLLRHARAMVAASERVRDELRELQASPGGRIVIGLPPRLALAVSAPLVQRFRERFPRAMISVVEGLSIALRESLIAGDLDLALLFDPPPAPPLRFEVLQRETLLVVAPAGSQLPERVALAALAQYPLVLPSAPNAIRALLDSALAPRGINLNVVAEVGAVGTALSLVERGLGCTVLPDSALWAYRGACTLVHAALGPPTIRNQLVLAQSTARPAHRMLRETTQLLRELDWRVLRPDVIARSSRA